MTTEKIYNKTILQCFRMERRQSGEVGVEIEMEGRNLPKYGPEGGTWTYHQDGSLRGEDNAEYVLRHPLPREKVEDSLKELFEFLDSAGAKIRKNSPNTSVHVHLNVQKWTLKKVYNLICLWYIFENLLVEWCGADRVGNLFCLRGRDAEAILSRLASSIRYGRVQDLANQEGLRYAALNSTALSKFGSLEFRCLAGVYERKVISTWVEILLSLKDYAEQFENPVGILNQYSRLGPDRFLKEALPKHWQEVYTRELDSHLHEGMRMIQGVAFCVNWEKAKEQPVLKKTPKETSEIETSYDELIAELQEDLARNGRHRVWRPEVNLGGVPVPPNWENLAGTVVAVPPEWWNDRPATDAQAHAVLDFLEERTDEE